MPRVPLRSWYRRLRLVPHAAFEHGMEAELRHHLELETKALVARGMTPALARDVARQRFGSFAHVKDDCRESWGMRALDTRRRRHSTRSSSTTRCRSTCWAGRAPARADRRRLAEFFDVLGVTPVL